jgi:hypothetical protein
MVWTNSLDGKARNVCRILERNCLEDCERKDVRESGCEDVKWTKLAQYHVQWWVGFGFSSIEPGPVLIRNMLSHILMTKT